MPFWGSVVSSSVGPGRSRAQGSQLLWSSSIQARGRSRPAWASIASSFQWRSPQPGAPGFGASFESDLSDLEAMGTGDGDGFAEELASLDVPPGEDEAKKKD